MEINFHRGQNVWKFYRTQNISIEISCSGADWWLLWSRERIWQDFNFQIFILLPTNIPTFWEVLTVRSWSIFWTDALAWLLAVMGPKSVPHASPGDSLVCQHTDNTRVLTPWLHSSDSILVPSRSSKDQPSNTVELSEGAEVLLHGRDS